MNTHEHTPLPVPSAMERDADGRLVALSMDCPESPPPPSGNAWLVAIDGSAHAQRAVAEMLDLACRMECTLHLVNVQPWLSREAAETGLAQRGWEASSQARAMLDEQGVKWHLHVLMGDAAESIVALAVRLGCRGIVVGSRGLSVTQNLLLGSVAQQVIHLSPLSVLVVR